MNRRGLAIVVLSCWVGALVWLGLRGSLGSAGVAALSEWPLPPGSEYYAVSLRDEQVGIASITVDTLPEGVRIDELLTLDLPADSGVIRRTSTRTESYYSKALRLLRWQNTLLADDGRSEMTAVTETDTSFSLINLLGASAETLHVTTREPVVLPLAVGFPMGGRASRDSGRILRLEIFDPASVSERRARARVKAESLFVVADSAEFDASLRRWAAVHSDTLRAWRLDALEHGLPVRRWVDATGMPVRIEYPFGLTWQRSAFELVSTNYRSQPRRPSWDTTTSLIRLDRRPKAPAPKEPSRPWLLRVPAIDDVPLVLARLLAEASNASLTGDTLSFPATPADRPTEVDSAVRTGWSGSTALIQSTDPVVRETAERIIGIETDTVRQLRRLASWVVRNIDLEKRPGAASAVRTLSVKRGTLQDRITLLVALARAHGIDAAPVAGLRWEGDHFYLDGWMEALPDVRLTIDPLTGAVPAGGDRWPLLIGAMARTLDLASPAGNLPAERVATEVLP